MAEFDLFANQLLEESKRFFERATASTDASSRSAYLHAALMLSFCALEAHINAIADEFAGQSDLAPHELGLLLERDVRLEEGQFALQSALRISRLEDRIEFIHRRFSGRPVDRTASWWSELSTAAKLRNELTHAKKIPAIGEASVKDAISAIIATIDATYQAVYKRKFPQAAQGLHSSLTF